MYRILGEFLKISKLRDSDSLDTAGCSRTQWSEHVLTVIFGFYDIENTYRQIINACPVEMRPRHNFIWTIPSIMTNQSLEADHLYLKYEGSDLNVFLYHCMKYYIYHTNKFRNPMQNNDRKELCNIRPILRTFASCVYHVKPPMST